LHIVDDEDCVEEGISESLVKIKLGETADSERVVYHVSMKEKLSKKAGNFRSKSEMERNRDGWMSSADKLT